MSFLPSPEPELQLAERLSTLVDEPIANRSFENLDEPEEVLCQCYQTLLKQQDLIQGLTSFHWWSQIDFTLFGFSDRSDLNSYVSVTP